MSWTTCNYRIRKVKITRHFNHAFTCDSYLALYKNTVLKLHMEFIQVRQLQIQILTSSVVPTVVEKASL